MLALKPSKNKNVISRNLASKLLAQFSFLSEPVSMSHNQHPPRLRYLTLLVEYLWQWQHLSSEILNNISLSSKQMRQSWKSSINHQINDPVFRACQCYNLIENNKWILWRSTLSATFHSQTRNIRGKLTSDYWRSRRALRRGQWHRN